MKAWQSVSRWFQALFLMTVCGWNGKKDRVQQNYFVSKNGSSADNGGCGERLTPCATFFDVYLNLSASQSNNYIYWYLEIYIDGQNAIRLKEIKDRNESYPYHPCLPPKILSLSQSSVKSIFITFNDDIEMNDWFPSSVCYGINYHITQYMFDANYVLKLSNLIVSDYNFSASLIGIIASRSSYSLCVCDLCQFRNIISTIDAPLIWSEGDDVLLNNTSFQNINTINHILHSEDASSDTITIENCTMINIKSQQSVLHVDNKGTITLSDVYLRNIDTSNVLVIEDGESITIDHATFININCSDSVVHIDQTRAFLIRNVLPLTITNCEFVNILTQYVVLDVSPLANVSISNISLNAVRGAIYHSTHTLSSNIVIDNVSLSLRTFKSSDAQDSLFTFSFHDTTNMNNVYCFTEYDTSGLCFLSSVFSSLLDNRVNNTINYTLYRCQNPQPLIQNDGTMVIHDMRIDFEVLNEELNLLNESWISYVFVSDAYGSLAFIQNRNYMEMHNIDVTRTISSHFIYNDLILMVYNSSFNAGIIDIDFNANALLSKQIISSIYATLSVDNSYFSGSKIQIAIEGGTFEINQCFFEYGYQAMAISNAESGIINNCSIANIGRYYGSIDRLSKDSAMDSLLHASASVFIYSSSNINISDNVLSGYDPQGLVLLYYDSGFRLSNNTFIIDDADMFYFFDPILFESYHGPLTIWYSDSIAIIANNFLQNHVAVMRPWIYFYFNDDVCVSANIFTNAGFYARYTTITSCLRVWLLDTVESDQYSRTLYSNMDSSLFNAYNEFIVSISNIDEIIALYHSTVAMDNVRVIYAGSHSVFASTQNSTLLLVDSYMNEMNVSYAGCDITANDRLASDAKWIAEFRMHGDCLNSSVFNSSSLNTTRLRLVQHLSMTKISVTSNETHDYKYYPGQLLTFAHRVMDRMENEIVYDALNISMDLIDLETNLVLVTLVIENNECQKCDHGILFADISMANVGDVYKIKISVDDYLVMDNNTLLLSITGCPTGKSHDVQDFHCQICNTDYFNLLPNNTADCLSCDPDNNEGIKCRQGMIYISYNHWMGIESDAIISAICPPNYCCTKQRGCDYMKSDKSSLCAMNRDSSSILCGKCKDGYSESLRSTQCVECNESFYFRPIIYPIILSCLWAIALILISSDRIQRNQSKKKSEVSDIKKYLSNPHFIIMINILVTRNIIYYQQALSQILSANPITALFVVFTQIFNLSISRNDSNADSAQCFIKGMNAKHKIVMDLLMPSIVIIFISMAHFISSFIIKRQFLFPRLQRRHNFPKCYSAAFVLLIGNILNVLFRLMHCQSVHSFYVHYYFGNEACYQQTWILCLFSLLFIIGIFAIIMIKLKSIGSKQRSNKQSAWNIFVNKYKPQYFWWEFILFLRRICIAMFSVSLNGNDGYTATIFIIVILIFIGLQLTYKPFIVHSANHMECCLLFCLIVVIVMEALHDSADTFKNIVMLLLILLPFFLLLYYIVLFIKNKKDDDLSARLLSNRLKYLLLYIIIHYLPTYLCKTTKNNVATADFNVDPDIDDAECDMDGNTHELDARPRRRKTQSNTNSLFDILNPLESSDTFRNSTVVSDTERSNSVI